MDGLVPVILAVPVEGGEHDGQDGGGVVTDQAHDVPKQDDLEVAQEWNEEHLLIIPVVKGSLRHLEVRTGDALGELGEEWHHHLLELCRLDHIQNFLQLIEEHDLLGTMDLGPEPEQ